MHGQHTQRVGTPVISGLCLRSLSAETQCLGGLGRGCTRPDSPSTPDGREWCVADSSPLYASGQVQTCMHPSRERRHHTTNMLVDAPPKTTLPSNNCTLPTPTAHSTAADGFKHRKRMGLRTAARALHTAVPSRARQQHKRTSMQ